jgi:hypothetical protein
MKFDHTSTFVTDALAVVKKADPSLFLRMCASPWDLRLAYTGEDALVPGMPEREREETLDAFPGVLGMTGIAGRSVTEGITFLNVPVIRQTAQEEDMPLDDFTADILAHEFEHFIDDVREPEAFAEGSRFACLPGISRTVCKFAEVNENMYLASQFFGFGYA